MHITPTKLHAFNVVLLTLIRLIEVKVTGEFEKIPNRLDCESPIEYALEH